MNEHSPIEAAGIGHNNPPAYDKDAFDRMVGKVNELADRAGAFIANGDILDEEYADEHNDVLSEAAALKKRVDGARVREKKVWDEKASEVQEAYRASLAALDMIVKKMKPQRTDWLKKLKDIATEKRLAKQAAAKKKVDDALVAAAAAESRNDVVGMVAAETAQKEAVKDTKAAEREVKVNVGTATGAGRTVGLRTEKYVEITDINFLFAHYRKDPRVIAELTRIATADVRAKDVDSASIPGIKILEREV